MAPLGAAERAALEGFFSSKRGTAAHPRRPDSMCMHASLHECAECQHARLNVVLWTAPCDTGPGCGRDRWSVVVSVCRGGSFRPPPALCVSRGRCETRAGHLACGSRRATEPTETSVGDVASRDLWVAAAGPRHRPGRCLVVHSVPHGYYQLDGAITFSY